MKNKYLALWAVMILILSNLAACGSPAVGTPSKQNMVVSFPDKNLETVVREAINKLSGDIRASDLQLLTSLTAREKNIVDLTGLENCVNLVSLDLGSNIIKDIRPLAALKNLTTLSFFNNRNDIHVEY